MPGERGETFRQPESRPESNHLGTAVAFARARHRKGTLSSGELNAVLAAERRMAQGEHTEADSVLIERLVLEANQHTADSELLRGLRNRLAESVEPEIVSRADGLSRGLTIGLFQHILQRSGAGSQAVENAMADWKQMNDAINKMGASASSRDLARLEALLRAAGR